MLQTGKRRKRLRREFIIPFEAGLCVREAHGRSEDGWIMHEDEAHGAGGQTLTKPAPKLSKVRGKAWLHFTQVMKQITDLGKGNPGETACPLPALSPPPQGNTGSSRQILRSKQQPSPLPGFCCSHEMLGSVCAVKGSLISGILGALARLRAAVCAWHSPRWITESLLWRCSSAFTI